MHYIGIDLIEVARIEKAIRRWRKRFLNRIYTKAELKVSNNKSSALAARFAAKEAVMKALGTGAKGVSWREIEILPDSNGRPLVQLVGRAQSKAKELKLSGFSLTLSHTKEYAIAHAIGNSQ